MACFQSFRQPLLTQRERTLRWVTTGVGVGVLLGMLYVVYPWWGGQDRILIGVCIAAPLGIAHFFLRRELLRSIERSRRTLDNAGYLICPDCLQPLEGTYVDQRVRKGNNATRANISACPECGLQVDAAALQLRWREAYRIHLDAWTPSNDGD